MSKKSANDPRATDTPKYGSKSSSDPNKRHYFRWESGTPGEGVGCCIHCGLEMKFVENGKRGGKHRVYRTPGTRAWVEREQACVHRKNSMHAPSAEKAKKEAAPARAA